MASIEVANAITKTSKLFYPADRNIFYVLDFTLSVLLSSLIILETTRIGIILFTPHNIVLIPSIIIIRETTNKGIILFIPNNDNFTSSMLPSVIGAKFRQDSTGYDTLAFAYCTFIFNKVCCLFYEFIIRRQGSFTPQMLSQ